MLEKLEQIGKKYLEIKEKLYDPEVSNDMQEMVRLSKQASSIEDIYNLYVNYKDIMGQIDEAKSILDTESDTDMIDLAKTQLEDARTAQTQLEEQIKIALLPRDPNDDKDIYLEIRPAAGGDEAGLFAQELLRMYLRYAELKGRRSEIVENVGTWIGGLKFAVVKVTWESVYSKLKFESWVHRVQRIPHTESNWRVHTSTVTVAIMPEVDDVEIHINPEDVEMDTYAASSAWGQHANKNETWVRLHHKPTGISVNVWDSRSQLQNREKARKVLQAKIYQEELEKQQREIKSQRSNQIWSWDRSEKIRTYNFPQDRVTDHRVKKSWSNIPGIMDWMIDDIVNDMILENQSLLLSSNQE